VRSGATSIGYVPDHAPEMGVSDDALAALAGVDYLIHDAQFLEHERPRAVDYGHATVDDAIRLAERVDAGSVVLFHHGPHRTDDALDEIGRQFTASVPIVVAAEGLGLDLA
jgi:ribonuclease BN (tRNA processing enzyme)